MKSWRRLLAYLGPYRAHLAAALAAMVVLAATTGAYPVLLDLLTTYLVEGRAGAERVLEPKLAQAAGYLARVGVALDPGALRAFITGHFLALFGAVVVVKAISQAVRFYEMGMVAQWVVSDVRRDLFRATLRQGAGFFGDQATGFLISRVVNDVSQVERAATYVIPVVVGDVLKVLVLGGVCFSTYPELSMVTLVIAPLSVFPIVRFGKLLKRYAKRGQEELGGLSHRVAESVGGIRVVHAYGGEARELAKFEAASERYVATMQKSVLVRAVQTPAMELIGVAAMLLTLGYAVKRVESGAIRPGEVVGFVLALVLLYEPLKAIGRLNAFVLPGLASAERIFDIVDRPPEVASPPDARPVEGRASSLRLEQVAFRYGPDRPLVLEGLDLELKRGKITALVGPSGGGKSTVAALVVRAYDPTSGRLTLDGIDYRALELASLRDQVALVAQDTFLFADTVLANIAYGRLGATREEIETAARRAFAHEFISALPKGYDTEVGERGAQLSGGQRQRIAIARAFLRDAPIIVLDEATSALDTESEREVQRALDALLQDRAALVIAHRLTTVRRADEILVVDRGRVVERGTHAELLALDAAYARLVSVSEGRPCI